MALGAVAVSGAMQPGVAAAQEDGEASVIGSWMVFVAYAGGGQQTRGLATFTPGGCFVGSISAFEGVPVRPTPSRGTTLHGSWKRVDNGKFALTAVRLHLDTQGILIGVMTTRITLAIDESGRGWSGKFVFTAADPSGTVFRSDHGDLRATRIEAS